MTRMIPAVMAAWLGAAGCGLLPVPKSHLVRFAFVPGERAAYSLDAADSAAVYRTEGLVVKVSYRSKQALNLEYPDAREGRVNLNPFTYGPRMDNDLGYAPDRFTVFEVDFNNIGRPRVRFAAQDAELVTDRGDRLRPWGTQKGEAVHTFEEYYRARRGPGGNDQQWYRQRLAIVEKSLYRGDGPLFKGQRQRGKLVFGLLHPEVASVRLHLREVVLAFDEHGLPTERIDLEFPFEISVEVEELE